MLAVWNVPAIIGWLDLQVWTSLHDCHLTMIFKKCMEPSLNLLGSVPESLHQAGSQSLSSGQGPGRNCHLDC